MKIKTSELIGPALDWAVGQCAYTNKAILEDGFVYHASDSGHRMTRCTPSTNWSQGGPIIEEGGIELLCNLTATEAERFSNSRADWQAFYRYRRSTEDRSYATTPLIAAMRCYVASKFGDEVEIPEELA